MYDVIPEVMSAARRGICPTCGAAIPLVEAGRSAKCEFCGGQSALQHRLRAIEAGTGGLQAPKLKGATRWLAKQARYEQVTCPGCGAAFEADTEQSIQTCKFCNTQSKLETRLLAITTDDVDPPQRRTRADIRNRGRIDYAWDVATEQLVWRILNEPDTDTRVALAENFRSWGFVNHTAAHFLPWLLKHVQADHDAVALGACDVIGKLLCEGDPTLWPGVIQACRGVVFDVRCKPVVLSELGLGTGVCVKTLIDAAEYAASHGARDLACHALWAVNTLIGRNFGEHPVIAEIVLYRLFYVTGPVLGWSVNALRTSYLRGRYPHRTLLRSIDEIGLERPELVPHLLECLYVPEADSESEYLARIADIAAARSWAGKAAACEALGVMSEQSDEMFAAAVQAIEPLIDDPNARWSVEKALYSLMCARRDSTAPAMAELVKRCGEALPDRLKREFIRRNPETPLLDRSKPYYWTSDPKRELDPDVEHWIGQWKEGINAAVDRHRARVKELQPMRDAAREREVEIFLEDGPATIPLTPEAEAKDAKRQQQAAARAEREKRQPDIERLQQEMDEVQQSYSARLMEMSSAMMAKAGDHTEIQRLSAKMTALSTEMQQKIAALQNELHRLLET